MGRHELAMALESVARQDYSSVETVVVDATGGGHPPLPSVPRRQSHIVRIVGGHRRLPRAQAANMGMLAARGEWLCFLDDDDTYDSHFVSAMVEAARVHPKVLLVYGRTRVLRADGHVDRVFGHPFNRALMHYGPLFYWQAALIRRNVVDLGCRFDEALEVGEDRDFIAQIAGHSDFVFVPVVGFNYHPHLGTSGTAEVNRDVAKTIRFESLVRAKAAGTGAYHTRRCTRLCARAVAAYHRGDRAQSRALFEALLREYPGDPNALHGLARMALDDGSLERAETLVDRAIASNASAAEFRLTRAVILQRQGRRREARQQAALAVGEPALRPAVAEFLRQLGPDDAAPAQEAAAARSAAPPVSRNGPCPCGSSKRHKHCCGLPATVPAPSAADRSAQQARAWALRGEALRAKALIDTLAPDDVGDPDLSRAAGEICFDLARCEEAYAFLERSAKLSPSLRTGSLLTACCDSIWQDQARASAHAMVLRLRERIEHRTVVHAPREPGPIHVVGTLGSIGGSENQAVNLFRMLSPDAHVRLWSTTPPLERQYPGLPIELLDPGRGAFPDGGTLILAGHYFECGDWWSQAAFDRVVIWVSLDLPKELVARLADIEETGQATRVDFTFCSRLSRDLFGLPGEVEYPLIDVTHYTRTAPARSAGQALVIGRHSRDDRLKHHPNDPALYRQLVDRGHRLRLLGGTFLQPSFFGDPVAPAVELLPAGSEGAREFLNGLDCFVYRKHPQFFETCGACILEAMAMGLPVIVFREGVGAAELIEHGREGFLVDTEAEALACIDWLAANPDARTAVGAAARRKVSAVMQDQEGRILAYYLRSAESAP